MQQIGRRLGVEAKSLCQRVRNKDDILDRMVDVVLAEIELPADRSSWRPVALQAVDRRPPAPAQSPDVAAAGRFMETMDQLSVIGTTSATTKPWRSYRRSWARFDGSAKRVVSR